MGQFTTMQTEQIKQCVLDCSVRRFTTYETQDYIRETLGISLSFKSVKNYRARLRLQAQTWIGKLAKSRRGGYVAEYKARIDEVLQYQRRLWEIANDKSTRPGTQVEAIGKLLACTGQLIELYDSLPVVNAIRDYDSAEEYRQATGQAQTQRDSNR